MNERVEQVLLAKYAHCQQFRLRYGNGGFVSPSCKDSLRVIKIGERVLFFNVYPARFTLVTGFRVGDSCTCCHVGVSLMQSHYTNLRGPSVACAYAILFAIIANK